MPLVTTADLRSEAFHRELIIPALNAASVVLRSIRRIDTTATKVNLPVVNDANIGWVAEGAALPDAGINPDLVQVTPAKLAAYADLSNETVADASASASDIVGQALAQAPRPQTRRRVLHLRRHQRPRRPGERQRSGHRRHPHLRHRPIHRRHGADGSRGGHADRGVHQPARLGCAGQDQGDDRLGQARSGRVGRPYPCGHPFSEWSPGRGFQRDPTGHGLCGRWDPHGSGGPQRRNGGSGPVLGFRVVGRFGSGFLYPAAVARIKDVP